MISHLQLNTVQKISPSAVIKADKNGHEFIIIQHKNFDAAFALQGGQLIHFQRKGHPPLIYLSKTAQYDGIKAIRGGVPICWPWFGTAAATLNDNLPAHGFARTSKWSVSAMSETDGTLEIEFSFNANEATKKQWNNDFSLTLKASLSNHIILSLITKNTGEKHFTYRGALHTYLNIGNINQCSVNGLAADYFDSLDSKQKSNPTPLTINNRVDSIYPSTEDSLIINDDLNKRKITISNNGNDSVVVWNPWVNGARNFIDMPDNGYQTMLCVESAVTANNGVLIQPGNTHTLTTIIK